MRIDDSLLVFVVIFGMANGAGVISCASPSNQRTPSPELCAQALGVGGNPIPNCVNAGVSDDAPEWVCAECSHNCDCKPGEYCPKGPGPFTGTCRLIADDDRIGRGCIRFDFVSDGKMEVPVKGSTDALACGMPVFSANRTFLRYDWVGACIEGVCMECEGGTLGWSVATASTMGSSRRIPGLWPYTLYPYAGSARQSELDSHRSRDGGTLSCPGSYCSSGFVRSERSWIVDVIPTGVDVAILVLIIFMLMLIFAITVAVCSTCLRMRFITTSKKKREIDDSVFVVDEDAVARSHTSHRRTNKAAAAASAETSDFSSVDVPLVDRKTDT